MGNPLAPDDWEDVKRLKHIFQNNPDVAKDYWQQLQDKVENPILNRELLDRIINAEEDTPEHEDLQRFNSHLSYASSSAGQAGFNKFLNISEQYQKREERGDLDVTNYPNYGFSEDVSTRANKYYDFTIRGLSGEQAGFTRGEEIVAGATTGAVKIAQGLLETGALGYDIYNDDAEASALEWVEEEFPELYSRGELDTFLGKAAEFGVQYGTGFSIANKIIQSIVKKKGKEYLKKRTFKQKVMDILAPAAISEPFVSTSRDVTLLQAFGLYDAFVIDDENLSPREKSLNLLKQKSMFAVEAPLVAGAIVKAPGALAKVGGFGINVGGKVMGVTKDFVVSPLAKGLSKEFPVNLTNRASGKEYTVNIGLPGLLRITKTGIGKVAEFSGTSLVKGIEKIGGGTLPPRSDWMLYNIRSSNNLAELIAGTVNTVRSSFRSTGILGSEGFELVKYSARGVDVVEKSLKESLENISTRVYDIAEELTKRGQDGSAYAQSILQKNFLDYVTNPKVSSSVLPKGTRQTAKFIRDLLNGIKKEISEINPNANANKLVNTAFKKDAADYLGMSFKILKTGSAGVPVALKSAVVDWTMKRLAQTPEYKDASSIVLRRLSLQRVDDLLDYASKDGLSAAKLFEQTQIQLSGGDKFVGNLLKRGETVPDVVQKMYGRVDDVRQRVLDTGIELANFVSKTRLYKELNRIGTGKMFFETPEEAAKRGFTGRLVKIGEEFTMRRGVTSPRIDKNILGPLDGKYTTPAIANAITKQILYTDNWVMNPIYKGLMLTKGIAQSTKTVYSPVTQVRNVTSAGLFAVANGHFGRGASLMDSIRTASRDLFSKDGKFDSKTFIAKINEYNEEGLAGSSLVTKELQMIAKDIFTPSTTKGIYGRFKTTDDLIDFLANNPEFKKLQGVNKTATQVYQLGDDLWKIFGYEFEKTRIGKALKIFKTNKDGKEIFDAKETLQQVSKYYEDVLGTKFDVRSFLDREGVSIAKLTEQNFDSAIRRISGNVIRNTYPNYNYVPTVIQNLRRIPLGNFISFPAEMIRTSVNLMSFGTREFASSNPLIRQQGAERLIGFGTAAVGFDYALKQAMDTFLDLITKDEKGLSVLDTAQYYEDEDNIPEGKQVGDQKSGYTIEQRSEALQRSFVPSWNSVGPLPFVSYEYDKNNRPIIRYINTAYQSPYSSVIAAPFYVFMNSYNYERLTNPEKIDGFFDVDDKAILKASVDAFATLLRPFVSDTIAFQGILDATIRGGKSATGGYVYRDEEPTGDKVKKSLMHIGSSFLPGAAVQTEGAIKGAANYYTKEEKDKWYKGKGAEARPYSLKDEFTALMSGIRVYTVEPYASLKEYEMYAYGERRSNTTGIFYNTALGGDRRFYETGMLTTSDKINDAFIEYQIQNYKINSEFFQKLRDAKILGVPTRDLSVLFTGRATITADDGAFLRRGTFLPRKVPNTGFNSDFGKAAKKLNIDLNEVVDRGQLIKTRNIFLNTPLQLGEDTLREVIDAGGYQNWLRKQKEEQELQEVSSVAPTTVPEIPIVQPQAIAAAAPPPINPAINPATGLSATEEALLSPSEKAIRLRNKTRTVV